MSLATSRDIALDRTIADVLDAVSRETDELHHSAVRLQTMASHLLDRAGLEPHDPLMEEAQALDALAQKLDALTGFLQRLSTAAPEGWRIDIAEAVRPVFLADLAKRLCREHQAEDAAPAVTGDFEMF